MDDGAATGARGVPWGYCVLGWHGDDQQGMFAFSFCSVHFSALCVFLFCVRLCLFILLCASSCSMHVCGFALCSIHVCAFSFCCSVHVCAFSFCSVHAQIVCLF